MPTPIPPSPQPGIPVGISACLLGAPVRFDGGHKRSAFCVDELGAWFRFVPLCPEQAIGLPVPREAIHLQRREEGIRLVGNRTGTDHTDAMLAFADRKAAELHGLCGYIVSKKSPTCGMERVKVHHANGQPDGSDGAGLFTQAFRVRNPLVPVEEDGRLNDPLLRENFVTRVFVLWRWRQATAQGLTPAALVAFHTAHKYLVMAHSVPAYRELGRLVAAAGSTATDELAVRYAATLMQALARPVSRGGHANALQHIMGYFKRRLPAHHKQHLRELIEGYRAGRLPLAAPLTLVRHFLADHPDDYLARQVYLAPHPEQLALRNFL